MSDRNDNNWNSSNASTESVGNRKTSQNKSLTANKCEDQMQRTDCDIQKDQLISGTTTAHTNDTSDSQTNHNNDGTHQTNGKSPDLVAQDKASDENSDSTIVSNSGSPKDMQSQHMHDQLKDLSQSSSDDQQTNSQTSKKTQNRSNKSLGAVNDTKSMNDLNDNSNHKSMNDKKDESEVRNDEYKCPVCDLKLDSQHTFTIHIRQHNPSDHSHTCRLCSKTLSSASSLDRHMLIHSGERPFKCRICSMAFTTNGNMHRHMRTHGADHGNDDTNGTDSPSSNRLIKSKKRKITDDDDKTPLKKREQELAENLSSKKPDAVSKGEIGCPICKKTLSSKSALHTHMEAHPNDSICCLDCGMIVNNYATYTQHRCTGSALDGTTQSLPANRMNFSSPPAVGFYDLSFTDFSSRKFSLIAKSFCEHNLRKASSPYHEFECDKCKRAFPCGSALNLHQSTHEGQTYCQLCRHNFATPALYMAHQIKHRFDHPMPMTGTIPKALDFRMDSSEVHKASYGDVPHSDKEDFLALLDLQNKGSQMNCLESNYKFTRSEEPFENSSYYIHAQPIPPRPTTFQPKVIVNGNEPESNKHDLADIQSILSVTSSANPMMSGIRSSPPAASPASPVQLGTSGTQPDSPVAADSANSVSPNTPSVNSCKTDIEEKPNDSIESNDKALSIVTEAEDESSPTFKCNKCSLKFKSQNALKRHNRGHTQGGHSYACHLCTYTSLDKSTLVRHLRTHNGERPFQCAICKYAFTTKANCERHVKKRHKKLQKHEIRNAMQYNSNMSTTSSLTQQNLTKTDPNLSLSPNSDSFPGGFDTVCKYCNTDFKFNRVLRHHLRSLHNSCNRKPFCCTVCKLGFSTKNNCIRHVVKQHPDMRDKLSSVVLANASMVGLCSDQSESESLYHDSTKDSLNISNDNSMTSLNGFSGQPSISGSQPNSSLAALCQIAKNISVNNDKPINLTFDSKSNNEDEDTECSGGEDQPLNLASHGPHEEQPLDLAVHALDLSCKPSQSNKEKSSEDMKQVNEAVRTAASSLLALRSMTATNVFPQNTLLPNSLQPNLFHPALSLTPPLPAHSSPSVSMLSPNNTTNSSMDDIYKVATFRISKNRLLPRNERSFTCVYCSAGFTLKSNMERHIKRKHPEFARPPRSRGMSVALSPSPSMSASGANVANSSHLSKCNNPTLSSKTRAALRVVLSNKVMGSTSGINSNPPSPVDSSATNLSTRAAEDNNNNSCDQNGDLASVSSLIDHSANSSNALKQYFNNKNEELDSNGPHSLNNASNSDSEPIRPNSLKNENSNGNSGKEDNNKALNMNSVKKRSAYTDSPNSVSCPYCARKFPWTSSLRRHILTHTGLKPYKCPKCPILFTTKSNCERHLIRKHNGRDKRTVVEQSVFAQDSKLYKCNVCPNSTFTTQGNLRKHYYLRHWTKTGKTNGLKAKKEDKIEEELNQINKTDIHEGDEEEEGTDRLNFKCYVCEAPFTGRLKCLKHIQSCHSNEYQTLQSKGAVDKVPTTQTRLMLDNHNEEYDAYGPEKISCVFCPRHFTLFDNLRRHMRVHLGERPFRCTLCPKKFSLKNSLLRHHRTNHPESVVTGRVKGKSSKETIIPSIVSSASSLIKETENSVASKPNKPKTSCNSLLYLIPSEGVKESEKFAQNDDFSDADNGQGSDLIQNLLGLQDSKILDDLLDSGDDSAARILGVKDLA